MNWYYFLFIWAAAIALLEPILPCRETVQIGKTQAERWRFGWALFAFLPVIYVAAFTTPRSDTVLYLSIYQNLPTGLTEFAEYLKAQDSGYTYLIFQWLIKNMFAGSTVAYRLILALLHSIPMVFIIRRYSDDYPMALFLFLANAIHLAWMMNGLRQFLAVSVIFAATPLMLKRRYVPLILIILFASTIHTSALLMLPVVFAVQGRAWNSRTLLLLAGCAILMLVFSQDSSLLDSMLQGTEYSGAMEVSAEMGDDGSNPIRVLVNSVPMLLSILGARQIRKENDPVLDLCVNMSIVTCGLNLIAMVTSGIMIGRLPIYTSMYGLILLPRLINMIFTKGSAKLVRWVMVAAYFVLYLYEYRNF